MKRKTFFLLAALLLCGSLSAQTNHYTYNYHDFEHKITVVAQINIDGVEQTSSDYEIGAFDGTTVTGSARIGEYGSNHYHRAYFAIFYNTGYDATFKLYNHTTGVELTNCTITDHLGEPLTFVWTDENGYGTNKKPVVFNFLTSSTTTFTKEITGYGNGNGNWYLIASPLVDETNPENIGGMLNNSYDLYRFNQAPAPTIMEDETIKYLEWENWKQSGEHCHFNLEHGKGYLYANSGDVTLTFSGTAYSGNGEVMLMRNDDETTHFKGWNLVGNPYGQTAYITKSFYRMNPEGTAISATTSTGAIEAMEGIFVIADNDGEILTFSTNEPDKKTSALTLKVSQDQGTALDQAIVSFGEESALPKFMLDQNSTKVYFSQDGNDYALVSTEGIGEMPVNFKAEHNGRYTLDFTDEQVTFSYLHLIDNMTGNDIDLLTTPNYSFEALTTDYASRFKLVFATICEDADSDNDFAFFSNGKLVVLNEGPATLQVIDLMGRIVKSETINGNANINVNVAPSVYMLRLMNGDDIKTQKIVME